jgi:Hypothetical methyltransferase
VEESVQTIEGSSEARVKFVIPRPIPPKDELVQMYRAWWAENTAVPYGYCWCGCGERTNVSTSNNYQTGVITREPRRYVRGHASRIGSVEDYSGNTCAFKGCDKPKYTGKDRGRIVRRSRYCGVHEAQWMKFKDESKMALPPVREVYGSLEEASLAAQRLGIKSQTEYWERYKEDSYLPPHPDRYKGWTRWGDFLGTGRVAPRDRVHRPYEDAREYACALRLSGKTAWAMHCKSGDKPDDVPADPEGVYRDKGWIGWPDFLGTGNVSRIGVVYRSFEDAREYAHSLKLRNTLEWVEHCGSGDRPKDVPASPHSVYEGKGWTGYGDFLGTGVLSKSETGRLQREGLVNLLVSLRPQVHNLTESELYDILMQGGQMPALRRALGGASPLEVITDIRENEAQDIIKGIEDTTDENLEDGTPERAADYEELQETFTEAQELPGIQDLGEYLRGIDDLPETCSLDDETIQKWIAGRVDGLWDEYANVSRESALMALGDGPSDGPYFQRIRNRFLYEMEAVEALEIPEGYSYTKNGIPSAPLTMQRRAAWLLKESRRYGNFSGVGTGKTLSAVLASRVIDARTTLIITNNATVEQWGREILNAYPDSTIQGTEGEHNYLIFNYEKFQQYDSYARARNLEGMGIDFVVLDEVQFAKQRDENKSIRRLVIENLLANLTKENPDLYVLAMSATPVINNLQEPKKLLELLTGTQMVDQNTQATIANALKIHHRLMINGFRQLERREELTPHTPRYQRNDLLDRLRGVRLPLDIERVLMQAKLDATDFHPGDIIYTHYVAAIIPMIRHHLEERGFRVGLYTGDDKSGLAPFLDGDVDILLGSKPVGTGLDGLQRVSNRIVILSPPWTNAEYEQIVGRVRRTGGFESVEIVIPQIILNNEGDVWSWDQNRFDVIRYKRTLSDSAVDGTIPAGVRLSQTDLLERSRESLEEWIGRVEEQGPHHVEHPPTTGVPFPEENAHRNPPAPHVLRDTHRLLSHSGEERAGEIMHERHDIYDEELVRNNEDRDYNPPVEIARKMVEIPGHEKWRVIDAGCGPGKLKEALPDVYMIGVDFDVSERVVAQHGRMIYEEALDMGMSELPLAESSVDAFVCSESLVWDGWRDGIREAHRVLAPGGRIFIAETVKHAKSKRQEIAQELGKCGFYLEVDEERRGDCQYFKAIK